MSDASPAAEKEAHLPAEHVILRVSVEALLSTDELCVVQDFVEIYFLNMQVVLLFE